MLGSEYGLESLGMQLQLGLRLFGDMGRVVVGQETDPGFWRISGVDPVQESDEVSAVMGVAHGLDDAASVEVQVGQ